MWQSLIEFFRSSIVEQVAGSPFWFLIGLAGQMIFGFRFVLQWLVSEYKKQSHVPVAFWYISIVGSLVLLSYSIHRKDPVFMLGLSLNTLIYVRNLHLIHSQKKNAAEAVVSGED
jgi:lipid-A-disaccharide synthase-like uncharacterized protein